MQTTNVEVKPKPGARIPGAIYKHGGIVTVESRLAKEHLVKARSGACKSTRKGADVDSTQLVM